MDHVTMLDGSTREIDLARINGWMGKPELNPITGWMVRLNLYLTPGERFVLETVHLAQNGPAFDDIPPGDTIFEIALEDAIDWFKRSGRAGIFPDIDAPDDTPFLALPPPDPKPFNRFDVSSRIIQRVLADVKMQMNLPFDSPPELIKSYLAEHSPLAIEGPDSISAETEPSPRVIHLTFLADGHTVIRDDVVIRIEGSKAFRGFRKVALGRGEVLSRKQNKEGRFKRRLAEHPELLALIPTLKGSEGGYALMPNVVVHDSPHCTVEDRQRSTMGSPL